MARIVADGLELQDIANGRWFEISVGGLDGVPEVRGSNVTIPGKTGQTILPKVADAWPVVLHGLIFGTSGSPAEDYLDRMDALRAVFDPIGGAFNIVVHPDAVGVGGRLNGVQTATITVEFQRFVGLPAAGDSVRELDIECVCYSDPIGWQVVGT